MAEHTNRGVRGSEAKQATTQVYTHLTNKELREVHEAFHARRRR